jgi:hypothetical protein
VLPDGRRLELSVQVSDDGAVYDDHGEYVTDDGQPHADISGDFAVHVAASRVMAAATGGYRQSWTPDAAAAVDANRIRQALDEQLSSDVHPAVPHRRPRDGRRRQDARTATCRRPTPRAVPRPQRRGWPQRTHEGAVAVTDAYEFDGGVFHPRCLIEAMIRRGGLSPAAHDLPTSEVLWQFAEANAVTTTDAGADWLPRRATVNADGADSQRACAGCDRPLVHDVSVPVRPDPIETATSPRPTAREIADLLADYRQMVADAGGWAHRIPRDQVAAWEARKHKLLARIEAHTELRRTNGRGDDEDGRRRSL